MCEGLGLGHALTTCLDEKRIERCVGPRCCKKIRTGLDEKRIESWEASRAQTMSCTHRLDEKRIESFLAHGLLDHLDPLLVSMKRGLKGVKMTSWY